MMNFDTPGQLLQSAAYKKDVDAVIDITHAFLIDPDKETYLKRMGKTPDPRILSQYKIFDDYAPYREADSFDILEFIVKRNMAIASIVAVGGDLPQSSMGQLIKVEGGMAKIGLSHVFDEKTMEMMVKLRQAHNIPQVFVDMLFGNVDDLQRKIFKVGNVLTAQAWYQGQVRYTDPRTGQGLNIDYDTRDELYPDALTGNDSWDRRDTARGIQNLIDHCRVFYKINGFYPEKIKMGIDLIEDLLQQEATAAMATTMGLINNHATSGLPSRVDFDVLIKMLRKTRAVPPIEEWDTQYEFEIAPGRTKRIRYLPSTNYCFVNKGSIERLWGLTLESAMGMAGFGTRYRNSRSKPKGGIFTRAADNLKLSPPESRTIGVGRMIPFNADGRLLGGRKVKEAA